MTAATDKQLSLQAEWNAVFEGSGQAIDWIEQVAPTAGEVRGVAEQLTRKLYKARNVARSLRRVATTPMSIGFFGISQAGKSQFVNAWAWDEGGELRSQFGATELNFEAHVNPVGGGAEATGVVTRFTCQPGGSSDKVFAVELRLFREIELAAVLVNSWFEEFDHGAEGLQSFAITTQKVDALLAQLEPRAGKDVVVGVASEDVALLREYVESHWPVLTKALNHSGYWRQALKLAPRLSVPERAQLLSVLWGGVSELTQTYRMLAETLQRLGNAEAVFGGVDCLVKEVSTDANGAQVPKHWERHNSVVDVNTLRLLNTPAAPMVQVCPSAADGSLLPPVSLSVAELTALTSELVFRLAGKPSNPIVESVDLLDFPGYRTRSPQYQVSEGRLDLTNLWLRGKVAYLFERYSEAQEMNALVMCTAANGQIEVDGLDKVLGLWIDKTQGDTPSKRSAHKPGLFWVMTKSDAFIEGAFVNSDVSFPGEAAGLMKKTLMERFGHASWMQEWGVSQPFNNTFMTRGLQHTKFTKKAQERDEQGQLKFDEHGNPVLSRHVEEGIQPGLEGRLANLGKAVTQQADFVRHVQDPAAVWEALVALNDGGMKRFSHSVETVAGVSFKLKRIEAQLSEVREDLLPALDKFYEAGGEGEAAKQVAIANQIVRPLLGESRYVIGELLAAMSVPHHELRDLYLNGDFEDIAQAARAQAAVSSAPSAKPAVPDDFDIFGGEHDVAVAAPVELDASVPELQSHDHLFARAAVDVWIKHLREIPEREGLLKLLNLPKEPVLALVRELVRSAERLDLPAKLAAKLTEKAGQAIKRDALVDRQVLATRLMLDDFAAWFDYLHMQPAQRPNGLLGARQPVFAYLSAQAPEGLPLLKPEVVDTTVLFAEDWLSGVALNTRANTGHRKGREITPAQNDALGQVLSVFRGSAQ